MDVEAVKSAALVVLPALTGIGTYALGRRQRVATTTGVELDNEKKALDLYQSMVEIANGAQDRLEWALGEHESMRIQLNDCVIAREQAERREASRAQQAKIDKAAVELVIAQQNHRIAELEMLVKSPQAGDG